MADEQFEPGDEMLDRAIADLKSRGRPGPSPQLDERIVAALQAADSPARRLLSLLLLRSITMKTRLRIGIVATLAVAAVVTWLVAPWGARVALADVLQQVREAQSVKYTMTMSIDMPGMPKQKVVSMAWMEGDKMRVEANAAGQAVVTIHNMQQHKMIMLFAAQKRAVVTDIVGLPKEQQENMDLLAKLRKIEAKGAKPLGEKEINGRQARGFEVAEPMQRATVWADVKTELPLLVEIEQQVGSLPAQTTTMSDFQWNVKIDPALFSLEVPKDYQTDTMTMNLALPTEKDLLAGLKAWAQINGDKFPEKLDAEQSWKTMAAYQMSGKLRREDDQSPEAKAQRKVFTEKVMLISRTMLFVGNPQWSGDDWHWAGAGVALGQANTPILWYRPSGSAVYHVIDGDLSMHEVKADQLPKVPSQAIQPATLPSSAPATGPAQAAPPATFPSIVPATGPSHPY